MTAVERSAAAVPISIAPISITASWPRALDAGLAIARANAGWTFVVLPAPVVAAAGMIAAWPRAAAVAWTAAQPSPLTIVGIGCARELRGHGAARWSEVIAAAAPLAGARAVIGGELVAATDLPALARPRMLGGAAFAPGTAAHAPWTGFGDAWFMLPRWTYVHDGTRAYLVLAIDREAASDDSRWHAELATHRAALATRFVPRAQPTVLDLAGGDAGAWHAHVEAIVDAIAAGRYEKVVAAHRTDVTLAGEVRVADVLAALDDRHPESVRVLVRPPNAGALIAATPERLVTKTGTAVACDALAGSIARRDDLDGAAAELLASGKDRREHDLVVHAIVGALGALGEVVVPPRPSTRALRHVVHMHTPIRAALRAPCHVLDIAARLHPTPAVGGTPTADAVAWIAAHEPAARGWYASPVGWFDLAGDGELAVAIRSGVLADDRAHLWAGAGIVAGSDPARELAETEIKLRTMLGALGIAP